MSMKGGDCTDVNIYHYMLESVDLNGDLSPSTMFGTDKPC